MKSNITETAQMIYENVYFIISETVIFLPDGKQSLFLYEHKESYFNKHITNWSILAYLSQFVPYRLRILQS